MGSTSKFTTIGLIIYTHSTRIHYATTIAKRLRRSSQTSAVTQENIGLSHFLIPLINTRNKKKKPYKIPLFLFCDIYL